MTLALAPCPVTMGMPEEYPDCLRAYGTHGDHVASTPLFAPSPHLASRSASAIESGPVDFVLPLDQLAGAMQVLTVPGMADYFRVRCFRFLMMLNRKIEFVSLAI